MTVPNGPGRVRGSDAGALVVQQPLRERLGHAGDLTLGQRPDRHHGYPPGQRLCGLRQRRVAGGTGQDEPAGPGVAVARQVEPHVVGDELPGAGLIQIQNAAAEPGRQAAQQRALADGARPGQRHHRLVPHQRGQHRSASGRGEDGSSGQGYR
jgi:hypothetical protein